MRILFDYRLLLFTEEFSFHGVTFFEDAPLMITFTRQFEIIDRPVYKSNYS